MRRRTLTYADAVRLIGEPESPAVTALGHLAGAGAGVVTAASVGTIDFFALRDQLVRWGHTAVTGLRERLGGLSRFDRTERLVAAHGVLVVTSFFEALDDVLADLGLDLDAAELTAAEQTGLATGTGHAALVSALLEASLPIPSPARPAEVLAEHLADYYSAFTYSVHQFLRGLRAFDGRLDDVRSLTPVKRGALARYDAAFRTLAGEVPEFRVWAATVDARATREVVRTSTGALRSDLAEIHTLMTAPSPADAVRSGLEIQHRNRLDRPILASDRVPDHVVLPRLRDSYVDPGGRVAETTAGSRPATEEWWAGAGPVGSVPDFVLGHLTTPAALTAPTVVLGHPGSGKSALTTTLAARLTDAGFLAVRVELRTVPGDTSIQTQIEQALRQSLGEAVSWPELARRARPALPVVILDGFDELLQATGLNRADYLEEAQAFQEREAELGRLVAVLVTSRTVVADRARFPTGTVVVRIAPFDEVQVERWLETWNAGNRAGLASRGLRPLPVDVVLAHGELAGQPLLLLLLALYDAGANALQRAGSGLGRVELYERLFADFIEREVDKRRSAGDRGPDVQREWRRLGAVALAILNRGGDVILEAELDRDLPRLLADDDLMAGPADPGRTLSASQLLVGRFFFVHESRATRDTGAPERSFEFLHATFGDYLAARLIVDALVDLTDEWKHQRGRRYRTALDAGFLYAATSFVTVTRRAPLWDFVRGLLGALPAARRAECRELALELLPEAGFPQPTWSGAEYEPRRKPFAARHAAFSANLVFFAVVLADGPVRADELAGGPSPEAWRQLSLLWRSQLDLSDGGRIWRWLRVGWRYDTDPTWLEVRVEDASPVSVYESLPWPTDDPSVQRHRLVHPGRRAPRRLALRRDAETGGVLPDVDRLPRGRLRLDGGVAPGRHRAGDPGSHTSRAGPGDPSPATAARSGRAARPRHPR
ncbi:NACHT domain-containing protein [Cryptosporangium arvum]|uniref:NACHT domain-containing protein n=1 Tax=Cryptosporangium arvum TaxID=80871 RepID=UPI0004B6C251|nr:ATP-binding protein [Cryptosporangium arvum]